MLPLLFSIGPINFYSLGLLLGIGFFLAAFFIWRRLKDLGIEEEKVIDTILLTALLGLLFGRLFFVILNLKLLGLTPLHWLFFSRYPGLSFWGGLFGIFLAVYWVSRRGNCDFWQWADEFVYGLMPFLILTQIGAFFDGSGFGKPTVLPWGIYTAGSLLKRQPLPLLMALGFFVLWLFLLRIERHWRTWSWYKSKANGLVFLFFGLGAMLMNSVISFWRDNLLYWSWLEIGLSLGLVIFLTVFIYLRSGRRQIGKTKKKN